MKEELIRDRIIIGVNEDKLREYLIDIEGLTLARCIQRAKQYVDQHESTAKMMAGVSNDNLDFVSRSSNPGYGLASRGRRNEFDQNEGNANLIAGVSNDNLDVMSRTRNTGYGRGNKGWKSDFSRRRPATEYTQEKCLFCNKTKHSKEKCPAKNAKCYRCGVVGHWARTKACKGKSRTDEVVCDEMDGLFLGDSE